MNMSVMTETRPLSEKDSESNDAQVPRAVVVRQCRMESQGVVSLELEDPDGGELPFWEPGAHLDLVLPSGLIRQYSLCGDPADQHRYRIAVLREKDGRGGSREIHESALVGQVLTMRGPRNHFALEPADRYVFIAGGIGITPILSMVRRAAQERVPWKLAYGGRSRASMAFMQVIAELPGGDVDIAPQDESGILDLPGLLSDVEPGTAVYCCGPEGLIQAVEHGCAAYLSSDMLHVERFGRAAAPPAHEHESVAGEFDVELRRTGCVLKVPADQSLIDVVREKAPDVMSSCEEGFCGTCETRVLEGAPEHNDTILSQSERDRGDTMMICVGRSKSPRLVLDL